MEQYEEYVYGMAIAFPDGISVEVPDELYNDYMNIETLYQLMQDKLGPYISEYNILMNTVRKERKIEELKKELRELEK